MLTQALSNTPHPFQQHGDDGNMAPLKKLCLQLIPQDIVDHDYLEYLQQSLHTGLGIFQCDINTRTKQIFILFDPFTANLAHIRTIIEDAGLVAEPIIQ